MPFGDTAVTEWLRKLEAGHDLAAERLWDVFFERLVRLVQARTSSDDRSRIDAEDVALSAFASFCRGVEGQRFLQVSDRHGLWRLLVSIAIRKLMHAHRDEHRLKRGGAFQRIEPRASDDGWEDPTLELISQEPTPDLVSEVAEEYERWMKALDSDELKRLVEWKLEGFTIDEIAAKCGRNPRTVERKFNLIRKILLQEISEVAQDPAACQGANAPLLCPDFSE